MSEQKFCEWCGQPTIGGAILCEACHGTQQQVERGELTRLTPPPKRGAGYYAMQILKAGAAALLSLIALGVGALGTCTFIGGVVGGGVGLLGMAIVAISVATLLVWLIYLMYRSDLKSTKPIRPSPPNTLPPPPRQIGNRGESQPPSIEPIQPPEDTDSQPPHQ